MEKFTVSVLDLTSDFPKEVKTELEMPKGFSELLAFARGEADTRSLDEIMKTIRKDMK